VVAVRARVLSFVALLLFLPSLTAFAEMPPRWEDLRQQRERLHETQEEVAASEQAVLAELFQLNRQLEQTKQELSRLEQETAVVQINLRAAEEEGARLQARLETRKAQFGVRARFFYEKGNTAFLHVLLGSSNFGDFLSRLNIVTWILRRDLELIREMRELRAQVERQQAELLRIARELNGLREQEADRRRRLEEQAAQKERTLGALRERRGAVEGELAQLERVWASDALPVLNLFAQSLHTLTLQAEDLQPDSVQVTIIPPSATVRLSEKNLNEFLDKHPSLHALDFRLRAGSVSMVGHFSGIELEITGELEIVGKTVLRYRPFGIRFHGFSLPQSVLDELVLSGRLDIELRDLIHPFSLLEVRAEDGYLFGKAGVR
jgi:peptidoglycan hydrolase CwlO-like protein